MPRVRDDQVKLRVLLKNKRTCCVCHVSERAVQLHHIDGDNTQTVDANLAVLCLTHHDQATAGLQRGQVGLGVKLTPTEVRAHKASWEAAVGAEIRVTRKIIFQAKRKQLELLFEFELTKAKNEILGARSRRVSGSRFAFLTQYVVEEFISGIRYRKALLDVFKDIALRGCADEQISLPLVAAVLDLHPHLQGQQYVRLDATDKSALKSSIDVLDTVGIYGIEICKPAKTLATACDAILQLVEIGSWYKFKIVANTARKSVRRFQRALAALSPEERRGMDVTAKRRVIDRTLRRLEAAR